jgi:hypothetical protein
MPYNVTLLCACAAADANAMPAAMQDFVYFDSITLSRLPLRSGAAHPQAILSRLDNML